MDLPHYLDHFRLNRAPFGATPDAALFYGQGARAELLGALAYAVTHGDGIVKITGDAGSGMTMLCHALAAQLAGQAVVIHMDPGSLGPLGMIHAVALALGLNPDGKRSDEVLRDLQQHLAALRAGGRHAVLVADHADLLPAAALEEIRLLTNLDDAHGKLLQIVLLGQHALNNSLRQSAMRQVRERITLSFVMPRPGAEEVPALLAHRLQVAGYEGLALFASDAVHMLASQARGDMRRVIALADQALAAAANEGAVSVSARHMQAAIRGRLPVLKPRTAWRPAVAGAVGVLAVLGVGAAVMLLPGGPAPVRQAVVTPAPARPAPAVPAPASPPSPAVASVAAAGPDPAPASATANVTQPAPGNSSLLQQTLKAGKTWLRDEPASHFSIKIEDFPASEPARAEAFLDDVRNTIGLGDVHAYPTFNHGQRRIGIAYGSYATEKQARKAMAALQGRWAYAPKIRNVSAIRAAAARAQAAR